MPTPKLQILHNDHKKWQISKEKKKGPNCKGKAIPVTGREGP
jgi:hypothetical protein